MKEIAQIESIMKRTGKPIYDSVTGRTFILINEIAAVLAVLNGGYGYE